MVTQRHWTLPVLLGVVMCSCSNAVSPSDAPSPLVCSSEVVRSALGYIELIFRFGLDITARNDSTARVDALGGAIDVEKVVQLARHEVGACRRKAAALGHSEIVNCLSQSHFFRRVAVSYYENVSFPSFRFLENEADSCEASQGRCQHPLSSKRSVSVRCYEAATVLTAMKADGGAVDCSGVQLDAAVDGPDVLLLSGVPLAAPAGCQWEGSKCSGPSTLLNVVVFREHFGHSAVSLWAWNGLAVERFPRFSCTFG
jgi:hypothetical protein